MEIENPDTPTETLIVPETTPHRPVRITYLVFGLLFLGIVAIATSVNTGAIPWSGARYLWPALLVAVGAIGLITTFATSRRRNG